MKQRLVIHESVKNSILPGISDRISLGDPMVADASGASVILAWVNATDLEDNDGSARVLVVTYHDQDSYIGTAEG